MSFIIETERLYLREFNANDLHELSCILSDAESMRFYPRVFSREQVADWIERNIKNYATLKHGLWAVILKSEGTFLGDCGITIQEIEGNMLPELGFHIKKEHCNKGYATEAARACINYAEKNFNYDSLYLYTSPDNIPSIRVAEKTGMKFVKTFSKDVNGIKVTEVLYCLNQ